MVIRKFWRARQKWARLLQVIGWEGADARTLGMFYTSVVQAVLLFGPEFCFMSLRIEKALGGFHRWVIQWLAGWMPHQGGDGTWIHPHLGEAMVEAGLQDIETYATHRQNTVTKYIATRPIADLCLEVGRRPGVRV